MNDINEVANLDSIASWIDLWRQAKADLEAAAERVEVAREKIVEAIGDAEAGMVGDRIVVTYRQVSARRPDWSKAKEILGDRYDDVCTTQVTRRFVVHPVDPS